MQPEQERPRLPPFRFTDPRQERIYRRLLLVGPGPAAFYKDACQIMANPGLLGSATHVVAHLLREIESALRDVLESIVDLAAEAEARRSAAPERKPFGVALVEFVQNFFESLSDRVVRLLTGGRKHKAEVRAILRALGIQQTDRVAKAWLRLAGGGSHRGLHGRAHRRDLAAPQAIDSEFLAFWDQMQAILDVVLDRFETRYAQFLRILDQLLAKTAPSKEDIKQLRNHLPNSPVAQGYFFERLASKGWLEPLRKAGFFKHPPGPEEDPEGGGFRLPGWPQSRYLIRVAKDRPKVVLEIILEAASTRNGRVHADFLEAARHMPPELAVKLVPKASEWLDSAYGSFLLMDKARDLVLQLAEAGQVDAALQLARALLALSPPPGE